MNADQVSSRGSIGLEYVYVGERRPIPDRVDWTTAPSQFKTYRGCAKVPLDGHAHATTGGGQTTSAPLAFTQLGRLLRDVYGLTRQRWAARDELTSANSNAASRFCLAPPTTLRPVPAGGARFPCELYLLAARDQPIPPGVYHYDPAHHSLDVIRTGDYTRALATGRESADTSCPSLSLLITVAFWKNVFKYGEFSYRLHSLDAGVVIGQSLAVCTRYELPTTVHFQFSDLELDRLLGLEPADESVYAVITLADAAAADPAPADADEPVPAPEPAQPHPQSIGMYPLPAKLHEVSMQQGGGPWPLRDSLPPVLADAPASVRSLPLPTASLNLLEGLPRRRSSRGLFSPGPLTCHQLATLLAGVMQGYSSDIGSDESPIRHTMLFCVIHDTDDVDPGVYYYEPARHTLEQVRAGDVRAELQATVTSWMFNLFQVNLCLFPVAHYEPRLSIYGDRWYRVQNMEAGIIVQRLYLAAAALRLGCHTQLGFHVDAVNTLLGLQESPLTSLIQVLIAPEREPGNFYECTL
jgi:SagB-type dehydrogenase family enzyme